MKKEKIKMYPCCPLQLEDSSYRIIRWNVVKKQFEVLGNVYAMKEDCEDVVDEMNKDAGPVEFEYEI